MNRCKMLGTMQVLCKHEPFLSSSNNCLLVFDLNSSCSPLCLFQLPTHTHTVAVMLLNHKYHLLRLNPLIVYYVNYFNVVRRKISTQKARPDLCNHKRHVRSSHPHQNSISSTVIPKAKHFPSLPSLANSVPSVQNALPGWLQITAYIPLRDIP